MNNETWLQTRPSPSVAWLLLTNSSHSRIGSWSWITGGLPYAIEKWWSHTYSRYHNRARSKWSGDPARALRNDWWMPSSVAIRTAWPDNFHERSANQNAPTHSARTSSSRCRRSNMEEDTRLRNSRQHFGKRWWCCGRWSDATVKIAAERRHDDDLTDSRLPWVKAIPYK